ncbi:MAG: hypothetical protein M2R45_04212 [Verrucomicrobia subdivision 3 bacterium]|nr:hypothetical protein [Limisphaerales bacterium]MCS1417051.1 hypothetical protein [Limisphaerales bacterium]
MTDIGTHWLDLAQTITRLKVAQAFVNLHTVHSQRQRPKGEVATFSGKISQVEAVESIPVETEDLANILLRFESVAPSNPSPGAANTPITSTLAVDPSPTKSP